MSDRDHANRHVGLVAVGVMAASHRIRSFVGKTGLLCSGVGFVCGLIAVNVTQNTPQSIGAVLLVGEMLGLLGGLCVVLWILATALSGIGRIVGEDVGLIEKRPAHTITYKTIEPYDPIRSP